MSGLLAQRRALTAALADLDAVAAEPDPQIEAERAALTAELADVNEQINAGGLTDAEAAELLADEEDYEPDDQQRRAALSLRVTEVLTAAPGWVDMGDLVETTQGRRLYEGSDGCAFRNARIFGGRCCRVHGLGPSRRG